MRSMKPLKLAGLPPVLALLVLALAGAGTASATQLCGDTTCETVYESGQTLEAGLVESTSATFALPGIGTVSCSTSVLKGKTTAKTGSPLNGEITGLTFEGCKIGETGCTVKAINLPYKATIAETGQGSGTLTASSGGSGSPGAEASCSLKCTATATEVALSVEGGAAAIVKAKEAKLKKTSGIFCPETMTWTAEYQVTTPQPMLVGPAPTVLCEEAPDANGVCPKGKGYPSKKVYGDLAAGVGSFEDVPATGKKISCEVVSFVGEHTENGKGEVGTLNYESKTGGPCSSNWAKTAKTQVNPPIAVTVGKKLPFTDSFFMYKPAGSAQGILSFGTQFNELALSVDKGAVACVYNPALYGKSALAISNGVGANPTLASSSAVWTRISETPAAGACPVQLLASYTLAMTRLPAPAILYIGKEVATK